MILIVINGCLDPYAPPTISGATNYLVVNGYLDAGDNSCTITLTRSQTLSDTGSYAAISDAAVLIEDIDGNTITLSPQGNGIYSNSNLSLNAATTYRLHIATTESNYYSDYVPVNQTPAIDSVAWGLVQHWPGDPNVNIYVSAHGTSSQSRYYLWNFQETWLYTAGYPNDYKFVNRHVLPNVDTTYFCWRTLNSTSILTASTTQLSQNIVNRFLVNTIPLNSVKLRDGYSILVNQLSVTKDAFEYWQQLKANTENLGTIFGPQPSQFSGNIHSATNPSEPVFGYFIAASVSKKRIFIDPSLLPNPVGEVITGFQNCPLDTLTLGGLINYNGDGAFVSAYGGLFPEGYLLTTKYCVDCRTQGGTTKKPDFW